MTIMYDDQFEDPTFEQIKLNGKDGAWSLYLEGNEYGDEITFENADTVEAWFAAAVEAAVKAGIGMREVLAVLR